MKKIKILEKNYNCEIDAEKLLSNYIAQIEKHFYNQTEVITDINSTICEILDDLRVERVELLVTNEDVQNIIQKLGTIEQIIDQPEDVKEVLVVSKKLFRNSKNKWIGGVASGLAEYLVIPVWVVRLAFIIALPAPIPSVFPYLLLWFFVPPTKTKSDELQMKGVPVSLYSLSGSEGYTKKRVLTLAKIAVILVALFMLLITAIIGINMISY